MLLYLIFLSFLVGTQACTAKGPCLNGGECITLLPGYNSCFCGFIPYVGSNCQWEVKDGRCGSHTCSNGGTCYSYNANSHFCVCPNKWAGHDCTYAVVPGSCETAGFCKNGGTCKPAIGGHTCACADEWTGLDCTDSKNVALGKTASQSSTKGEWVARNGVDGVIDLSPVDPPSSIFDTGRGYNNWWMVDLGTMYSIYKVTLYNRLDLNKAAARDIELRVGATETTMHVVGYVGGQIADVQHFLLQDDTERARYVKLIRYGVGRFHLTEVQVFGDPEVNIAVYKTATQSSTLATYGPERGVDGVINRLATETFAGFCTNNELNAWWQVDLGRVYRLYKVRLYDRLDYGESSATSDTCPAKFRVVENHSACLTPSPNLVSSGVSAADITTILQLHNNYRGGVTPSATNMLKMTWDPEVAQIAQAWANQCIFQHDTGRNRNIPGRLSVGQNLCMGYNSWTACIDDWYNEKSFFVYGAANNDYTQVGHYTQMVWADSNKIGCGFADCGSFTIHACNYAPVGNIGGISQPYETGTACSTCQTCSGGLCDCGDLVCENGGTLNRSTCTCTCAQPFHKGPRCQLDCANLTEPWYCGTGSFDVTGCTIYAASVPYTCPITCGVCPYGGIAYQGSQNSTVVRTKNVQLSIGVRSGTLDVAGYVEGAVCPVEDFDVYGKVARYIRLTQLATQAFHLSEVRVYLPPENNLAFLKPTSMSSVYPNAALPSRNGVDGIITLPSRNGVDGIITLPSRNGVDGIITLPSGTFTGFATNSEDFPWWRVDLKDVCRIDSVIVYNNVGPDSLIATSLEVSLGTEPDVSVPVGFRDVIGEMYEFTLNEQNMQTRRARYVTLTRTVAGSFHLSEVVVLGGPACPPDWFLHDTSCYRFSTDTATWLEADAICRNIGGKLVEIESRYENEFLKTKAAVFSQNFWIGLTDVEVEGTWKWANQQYPWMAGHFANWIAGKPGFNYAENYALMSKAHSYKWTTGPCGLKLYYICEH